MQAGFLVNVEIVHNINWKWFDLFTQAGFLVNVEIVHDINWKWFDLGNLRPNFRWTADSQIASSAPGWKASLDTIARLAQLRDSGAITEAEFEREKAKLLDQL